MLQPAALHLHVAAFAMSLWIANHFTFFTGTGHYIFMQRGFEHTPNPGVI
jgi:hypothetical protein